MSHLKIAITAALTLALAGCDKPAPRTGPAKSSVPDASVYRKKMLALKPEVRNDVLFKAIASNNLACPSVEKSAYQEDYKDMSMWVVRCQLSGDFAVFVSGAGFAQVRQCNQEKQLGLPECKPLP